MTKLTLGFSVCALAVGSAAGAVHTLDYRVPHGISTLSVASVPHDGELRRTDMQKSAAPSASSEFAVGDELDLRLFEGKDIVLTLREKTPTPLGGTAFLAEADGYDGVKNAVVVETEDGYQIDVQDYLTGKVYTVASSEGGVTVREIKPPEKPCTCGTCSLASPCATNATCAAHASAGKLALASSATSGPVYVDILVAYDTMAASWAKTNGGGVQNFAEVQVQKMNTAIANTGLDAYFRYRLVGTYEVGGSAGGSLEYALNVASGAGYGSLDGAAWASVAPKRDEVAADIVCVLIDTGSEYGTVGLGWALESKTTDPSSCGFNACAIRAVANGHTMTHEVGHNMGAGHSDMMSSNRGPQYHTYSCGYYFYIGSVGYYTIMSYNTDGYGNYYTSVPYFSSPDYKYNGVAVGNATHDNTRTLRELFATIAENRGLPTPPILSAAIGIGLDAEAYVWKTSATYPWTRVTDVSCDGVDSSHSCEMTGAQVSWTETQVVGPASLTFKLRLRSLRGQFILMRDGVSVGTYGDSSTANSGSKWISMSYSIPAGVHTMRFAYAHAGANYSTGGNGAWIDNVVFAGGKPYVETGTAPTVDGDDGATVTGNADDGFVVVPSAGKTDITVTIPAGLDPQKVTVEVSTDVLTVKPSGAKVRVKKGASDITAYLDIPAADGNGVVNMHAVTVKDKYVQEAMDVSQGAVIVLDPNSPSLTTPPTRSGLTYTLYEGTAIKGMSRGDSKLGNGSSWTPRVSVNGGASGFYSIRVSK